MLHLENLALYALCGSRPVLLFELYLKLASLRISFVLLGPLPYLMKMIIVSAMLGCYDTFRTMCDKEQYTTGSC